MVVVQQGQRLIVAYIELSVVIVASVTKYDVMMNHCWFSLEKAEHKAKRLIMYGWIVASGIELLIEGQIVNYNYDHELCKIIKR